MKKILLIIFLFPLLSIADEGMWIPMLIKGYTEQQMQEAGGKLTAEQIYSMNQASLKDCIVQIDGCTAGVISAKGLLLTNHHCAYSGLQSISTLEKNYLENGYWAKSGFRSELSLPNATAAFLQRIEDVTARVLENIKDSVPSEARKNEIEKRIKQIEKEASENGKLRALVREMFSGNAYYLFVSKVYKDIRLVGAPPSSIGKFGGETDNWMWPRHTGDFTLLRVYGDSLGNPATYNEKNKPISTPKFLPISLGGVAENDFAMIMGFPGRTNRYATSDQLKMLMEQEYPARVKLNGAVLESYKEAMDKDESIKIKYASKYSRRANGWKNNDGQEKGLRNSDAIKRKEFDEKNLTAWIFSDEQRKKDYGMVYTELQKAVQDFSKINYLNQYYLYAGRSSELVDWAAGCIPLLEAIKKPAPAASIDSIKQVLTKKKVDFYKNYVPELDKKTFSKLLAIYVSDVPLADLPEPLKDLSGMPADRLAEACNKFAEKLFKKTSLNDATRFDELLKNASASSLSKDAFIDYAVQLAAYNNTRLKPFVSSYTLKTEYYRGRLIKAMMESRAPKPLYADANSTIRLSYGKITPYIPKDGVRYHWQTFGDGIIEKAITKLPDYKTPPGLLNLLSANDFGRYAQNGKLPVAFLTNNDITGGNSGSPVLNKNGEIIGLAYDGNWEGVVGDMVFDPALKRTICCDIRYVCFIIEKFAFAQNIMSELLLVP
jgi:hypothetical protein